jgi:putative lipoprotein
MRAARSLVLFALLPVFAGCQLFSSKPVDSHAGLTRLQGELVSTNGELVFQPCVGQQRNYVVRDSENTTLVQDAQTCPSSPGLVRRLRGQFIASKTAGSKGEVNVNSSIVLSAAVRPAKTRTSSN